MKWKSWIVSFLLLPGVGVSAEPVAKVQKRVEIELKDGYNSETVYRCSKGYFVIEAFAEKKVNDEQEIRYSCYNNELAPCGEQSLHIPTAMKELQSCSNDSCIYKLYANRKNEFLLSSIAMADLKISTVTGQLPAKVNLLNMKVVGGKAWFQTSIKGKSCILQVNLKTGETLQSAFVEKKWNKKTSIVNYQLTPESDELLVFMNRYIKRGECELSQTNVNGACELCDTIRLTGTGDKLITSVSGSRISPTEMIYSGTYSRYNTQKAEGVFFAKSMNNRLDFIRYKNFEEIKSFADQASGLDKAFTSVVRKLFKKSKTEFGLNYNITMHDVIRTPQGYLLIGELYEPSYTSVPMTSTMMINGMVTTRTTYMQVFNGYQYSNAIVVSFSENGEPQWDQSFSMYASSRTYHPYQHLKISDKTDKQISIVYTDRGVMMSKVLSFDGKVLVSESHDLIATGNESEKTTRTLSNADYWYGNYFLVYGIQTVKNKEDKTSRRVYYVNKIEL